MKMCCKCNERKAAARGLCFRCYEHARDHGTLDQYSRQRWGTGTRRKKRSKPKPVRHEYTGEIRAGDFIHGGFIWGMEGEKFEIRSYADCDHNDSGPRVWFATEAQVRTSARYKPNPEGTLLKSEAAKNVQSQPA